MIKLTIFNILYEEGDINLIVDNLETDENGITAQMRFGGNRFACYFPWPSIKGMVSRKAVVNFPPEGEDDHEEKIKKDTPPLKLIK
ncbi:MAG: hypothetical protein JRJ08_03970 [Deltaproteobacteria bacterium]|nr:hypothetical protein [Deltaproteobacteria bacterium]